MIGYMRRQVSWLKDPYTYRAVYFSYVRSKLEYASVVWHPHQQTLTNMLERTQNRFARFAVSNLRWCRNSPMPPSDHLRQLIAILLLAKRRTLTQIMFAYDILTNIIDSPCLLENFGLNCPIYRLRQTEFFFVPGHSSNYTHHNPISQSLREFNAVSDLFDFDVSRQTFKRLVKDRLRI